MTYLVVAGAWLFVLGLFLAVMVRRWKYTGQHRGEYGYAHATAHSLPLGPFTPLTDTRYETFNTIEDYYRLKLGIVPESYSDCDSVPTMLALFDNDMALLSVQVEGIE